MHRVEALMKQFPAAEAIANRAHLTPEVTANEIGKVGVKSDDDIVIVSALRTAITKARRGGFKDMYVEDILAPVLKGVIDKTKLDPKKVGDIVVGTVLGSNSQRANEARIAAFLAGFPYSVPIHIINRQCSSGLQAIAHVAANIRAGFYDIGIAAGVESMSTAKVTWEGGLNPKIFLDQQAKDCLLPMGITSENVAAQWKVTRQEQDEFSLRSHQRAVAAIEGGKFKNEIVPVKATVVDKKTGTKKEIVVDTDEGARKETTLEGLSKLKPAFQPGGSTTAGNASQVSDGAAAVLLMKRKTANQLGLPIEGVFRGFSVVGVPPAVMGIGPAYAIPAVLEQVGLTQNDIDVFEINEAFASQAVMTVKQLNLPAEKVNPNGGAIALGHPLGCTGARLTATLLNELKRRKGKYGIVSMCIGSGMGAAGVFEVEH